MKVLSSVVGQFSREINSNDLEMIDLLNFAPFPAPLGKMRYKSNILEIHNETATVALPNRLGGGHTTKATKIQGKE